MGSKEQSEAEKTEKRKEDIDWLKMHEVSGAQVLISNAFWPDSQEAKASSPRITVFYSCFYIIYQWVTKSVSQIDKQIGMRRFSLSVSNTIHQWMSNTKTLKFTWLYCRILSQIRKLTVVYRRGGWKFQLHVYLLSVAVDGLKENLEIDVRMCACQAKSSFQQYQDWIWCIGLTDWSGTRSVSQSVNGFFKLYSQVLYFILLWWLQFLILGYVFNQLCY